MLTPRQIEKLGRETKIIELYDNLQVNDFYTDPKSKKTKTVLDVHGTYSRIGITLVDTSKGKSEKANVMDFKFYPADFKDVANMIGNGDPAHFKIKAAERNNKLSKYPQSLKIGVALIDTNVFDNVSAEKKVIGKIKKGATVSIVKEENGVMHVRSSSHQKDAKGQVVEKKTEGFILGDTILKGEPSISFTKINHYRVDANKLSPVMQFKITYEEGMRSDSKWKIYMEEGLAEAEKKDSSVGSGGGLVMPKSGTYQKKCYGFMTCTESEIVGMFEKGMFVLDNWEKMHFPIMYNSMLEFEKRRFAYRKNVEKQMEKQGATDAQMKEWFKNNKNFDEKAIETWNTKSSHNNQK